MSVLKISEENFEEEVMKSEKPVILDFYADWCGPCKMMSPIIDGIADELGEEVKVGKVNTDENLDLAQKFNIRTNKGKRDAVWEQKRRIKIAKYEQLMQEEQ